MPRIGLKTFGEALAGSDRPFVLASGLLGLAPGRVATERDGHRPDSGAAPLIGGAQTRLATTQMVLSLASRGVRSSVMRLPPTVHVVVMLDWNLPDGAPSDTPELPALRADLCALSGGRDRRGPSWRLAPGRRRGRPVVRKSLGTSGLARASGRAAREKLLVGGVGKRLTLDTELARYHAGGS